MSTDWNNIRFRASSWGNLLTEPVTKEAKAKGELSKTCQKELILIYNQVKYGRKKDLTTKQMDKGILCEEDAITIYSRAEKKLYVKNQKRLENEWFTGHPDISDHEDIMQAEEVDDIKCSWEMDTFTPKLLEEVDKGYEAQLNVYFDLTGAKRGAIVYCLVSAPENMVLEEQRKLLYRMNVISEESPEFKEAAAEMAHLMTFEDIDYRERVIKKPIVRDDELIEKMKAKVPRLREWLADFEKKHMAQYPK